MRIKKRLPAYSKALEPFPNYNPVHLTAEWTVARALGNRGVICLCCPPEPGTFYDLSRLRGRDTWILWKQEPKAALDLAKQAKAAGALELLLIQPGDWLFRPPSPSTQ